MAKVFKILGFTNCFSRYSFNDKTQVCGNSS